MKDIITFVEDLYRNFNSRNIETVIANMTEDVQWANGMEGGYCSGQHQVRDYWTRQFSMINPTVTPIEIDVDGDVARVKVHQVVHDIDEKLLLDQVVVHAFRFQDGKIKSFDIEESARKE